MATPETNDGPDYSGVMEGPIESDDMAEESEDLSPEQEMLIEQMGMEPAQGVALVELIRSLSSVDPFAS